MISCSVSKSVKVSYNSWSSHSYSPLNRASWFSSWRRSSVTLRPILNFRFVSLDKQTMRTTLIKDALQPTPTRFHQTRENIDLFSILYLCFCFFYFIVSIYFYLLYILFRLQVVCRGYFTNKLIFLTLYTYVKMRKLLKKFNIISIKYLTF